jgi:PHD/YefM family antitoxin component YafN of YafNO toxin-antitoxin module
VFTLCILGIGADAIGLSLGGPSHLMYNVDAELARYILHGTTTAIISVDDLAALEETLEILSDQSLMASIREGEAALQAGDFVGEEEVRADLARRRLAS